MTSSRDTASLEARLLALEQREKANSSGSLDLLEKLEEDLTCPVCGDLFSIPASLRACSHVFCSECIHIALKAQQQRTLQLNAAQRNRGSHYSRNKKCSKTECPRCRTPVLNRGDDVLPQRRLEVVTLKVKELREKLRRGNEAEDEVSDSRASLEQHTSLLAPACGSGAPLYLIKRSSRHYHALKKKQLQKLCAEEGLSESGSEKDLVERHQAFVRKWNANCDSVAPRSHADIVRDVELEEYARNRESSNYAARIQARYINAIKSNMASEAQKVRDQKETSSTSSNKRPKTCYSGNAKFDEEFMRGFDVLIADYRAREKEWKMKQQEGTQQHLQGQENADDNSSSDILADAQSKPATEEYRKMSPTEYAALAQDTTEMDTSQDFERNGGDSGAHRGADSSNWMDVGAHTSNNKIVTSAAMLASGGQQATVADSLVLNAASDGLNIASSTGFTRRTSSSSYKEDRNRAGTRSVAATRESLADHNPPRVSFSSTSSSSTTSDTPEGTLSRYKRRKSTAAATVPLSSTPSSTFSASAATAWSRRLRTTSSSSLPGRITGPWKCEKCTFFNLKNTWSKAKCEMCESKREGQQGRLEQRPPQGHPMPRQQEREVVYLE